MANKTFTTFVQIEDYMNQLITVAVGRASETICAELRNCIDTQYYQDPEFSPNIYRRTESFLNSATAKMLSGNSAEIFIDENSMHYYNNFDPTQVIDWAGNSQHGADYYQTGTTDFWTVFMEWADNNVIQILKKELKKVGLDVK